MSAGDAEVPITHRVAGRPSLRIGKIREVRPHDLGLRFISGAITSIVSGVLGTAVSARVGGIFYRGCGLGEWNRE